MKEELFVVVQIFYCLVRRRKEDVKKSVLDLLDEKLIKKIFSYT